MGLFKSVFGANAYSNRELKRIEPIKNKVLDLDEEYQQLTDAELKAKTQEFKDRLEAGETLDDVLPEALATVREAAWRVLEKKPYPVQIIGAIVLHQGRIAEMKTGEGKTLVACLAAYANALSGKGVHVDTVNDYLAKTQAEEMGKVLRWLGLTVGCILHGLNNDQRRAAYNCDVTYGTNNELGFDYLRDNMVTHKEERVQREPNFAIVDEVDSILIDEARTPLIISGRGDKSTELYAIADRFAKTLVPTTVVEMDDKADQDAISDTADYIIDEKAKTATITQRGVKKAEQAFRVENLMDPENMTLLHHINQALKANGVMKNDIDYVVKDGEIIIVDEFTGRLMLGRRFNDGLHQAIEAKEGVKIKSESRTLATITFQNFFRLYTKLSGMTGTAMTEEDEFKEIYKLDVIAIPTNRPVIRIDHNDQVYSTEKGKYHAIIEKIIECHDKGQPILVGTVSIEKSELLSAMLKRRGVKHEVLNAKHHAKEAEIVAQAGKYGAVTIATNMAGRGTDIMLGGNAEFLARAELRKREIPEEIISEAIGFADTDNEEILAARKLYRELYDKFNAEVKEKAVAVKEAGGLFILGTERHESRRIDNQLRGRSGRQGDEGESCFFLSVEDDLMRIFAGDRLENMMRVLNVAEDMPIESKSLTKIIESSQKKVEGRNFSIRKNVLNYDDVMNAQREIINGQRFTQFEDKFTELAPDATILNLDPREGEPLEGVSAFGADVIREMNRLGILVDLSHASERSFYDALDISQTPIVCSHSSARVLCDHPRNLTDDQLRALAAKGGVAQVTFYNGFLRTDGQASILDAVAHLNHMVQVAGIEHVGIGTDFDGDGGVPGLASAAELINFTRRLLRERYTEADLRLIWGGNFLRVMEGALHHAKQGGA